MNKYKIVLSGFLAINIHMNLAAYNSFDLYYNAQLDDLSVVDESVWDAIRSGVAAGMLSLSPFSGQAADKTPAEKSSVSAVQAEKTYAGFTESQAKNIIARTLYMEARSEGTTGIDAVASVILNRAGGKAEELPVVCFKKSQFSCWNDINDKTPATYEIIKPSGAVRPGANQTMWIYCEKVATKLLNGTFKSTIGTRNSYHTTAVTPDWDSAMADKKTIGDLGSHIFGYLPEQDGYRSRTKKPTNRIYIAQKGDQLGKIALKFNTTKEKLIALNPKYKKNPNLIRIGDKIIVPEVG